MKELLHTIVKHLVTHQDQIVVTQEEDDHAIALKLQVAPDDIGKIIGKNGRVIKSIRTVIKSGGFNTQKRIIVEIIE